MSAIDAMLDRRLIIQRQTTTQSASGAAVRAFVDVTDALPFAVAPASDKVVNDYARRKMVVDHTLFTNAALETLLPASGGLKAGLQLNDRIRDTNNNLYVVVGQKHFKNAGVCDDEVWEIHTLLSSS